MPRNVGRWVKHLGLVAGSLGAVACVSVRAPERIEVNRTSPPPVDSGRIPQTSTHEEARQEILKAYQNIQYLEQENERLSRKSAEYKAERDACRDRLKAATDD